MSYLMRSLALGIESFQEPGITISFEEEAILVEGAANDLADAQQTQAEVGRVEDIVDGLEDLAAIADQIETATPTDVAMVDTAQRLALAGSDVDSEEVTPSLESFVGRTISTEGIKELAWKLWESLKKTLKKIWSKIEGFFYKVFGTIPNLRKSLESLKKRANEMSSKTMKGTKTELGTEVNALCTNYTAPKKGKEIVDGFKQLNGYLNSAFDKHHKGTAAIGEKLADSFNEYDFEKGEESLRRVVDVMGSGIDLGSVVKLFDLGNYTDRRFAKGDVKKGPDLFGNKSLFLTGCSKITEILGKKSTAALRDAEFARAYRLDVMVSAVKEKDAVTSATIDTMTVGEVEDFVVAGNELLDLVEEYQRGKAKKEADKARERLETATDKLTANGKKQEDMASADIAYYRSALNFNSWFIGMATQPNASLCSLGLAAIRAGIVACNKSLSNYG